MESLLPFWPRKGWREALLPVREEGASLSYEDEEGQAAAEDVWAAGVEFTFIDRSRLTARGGRRERESPFSLSVSPLRRDGRGKALPYINPTPTTPFNEEKLRYRESEGENDSSV